MNKLLRFLAFSCCFFLLSGINAQTGFTKADSGWMPVFNGKNFDGLYSRMYKKALTDIPDRVFSIRNGAIHVSGGGGHIGTDRAFRHYRMRVDYRFGDNTGPTSNAGLMYHVDETVPRMMDNWSRSIECQMRKTETGDFFSIVQVTADIPVSPTCKKCYKEGSSKMGICPKDSRNFLTRPNKKNPYKDKTWNTMEVIIRGADSVEHIVNRVSLLKAYKIRIPDGKGGYVPYDSGSLALQAEGAEIVYRNWEIMELPANGPSFLHRILVTSPKGGEQWQANTQQTIRWASIGKIGRVKIEFRTGQSSWQVIEASAQNTGSYGWTVPKIENSQVSIRVIGGKPWVQPGMSKSPFSISSGPVHSRRAVLPRLNFRFDGHSVIFNTYSEVSIVRIWDTGGHRISTLSVKKGIARWDPGERGQLVNGLYLFRAFDAKGQLLALNRAVLLSN